MQVPEASTREGLYVLLAEWDRALTKGVVSVFLVHCSQCHYLLVFMFSFS